MSTFFGYNAFEIFCYYNIENTSMSLNSSNIVMKQKAFRCILKRKGFDFWLKLVKIVVRFIERKIV